ncbi:MAG: hypothetical protein ACLQDM_09325 [Bradyrhizobium sp.]
MGFSFRGACCVRRVEGRLDETHAIKINRSPHRAAKTKKNPADDVTGGLGDLMPFAGHEGRAIHAAPLTSMQREADHG